MRVHFSANWNNSGAHLERHIPQDERLEAGTPEGDEMMSSMVWGVIEDVARTANLPMSAASRISVPLSVFEQRRLRDVLTVAGVEPKELGGMLLADAVSLAIERASATAVEAARTEAPRTEAPGFVPGGAEQKISGGAGRALAESMAAGPTKPLVTLEGGEAPMVRALDGAVYDYSDKMGLWTRDLPEGQVELRSSAELLAKEEVLLFPDTVFHDEPVLSDPFETLVWSPSWRVGASRGKDGFWSLRVNFGNVVDGRAPLPPEVAAKRFPATSWHQLAHEFPLRWDDLVDWLVQNSAMGVCPNLYVRVPVTWWDQHNGGPTLLDTYEKVRRQLS